MDNSGAEKLLKEIIEELVSQMGFSSEIEIKKSLDADDDSFICNIKTEDSNFLIGQYGINLQATQHIVRLLVRKKSPEKINFILDVNSYRQEKKDSVIKLARDLAEEAISERRAVVLRPMSPYERRVVHLELSKNDQIKTESIGDGESRRVVIKPSDLI